jgi:hypothetical protein
MSLIQQALEKTKHMQETKTTDLPPAPPAYDRDPMGTALEQELIQVQQSYAQRRRFYWRVFLGVLLVCLAVGISYVAIPRKKVSLAKVEVKEVPQVPAKIVSGYIYRLTGITNIGGKDIAVINNRLVGVGDALNNRAVVKAIDKGEVRLDIQGKEIVMTM